MDIIICIEEHWVVLVADNVEVDHDKDIQIKGLVVDHEVDLV